MFIRLYEASDFDLTIKLHAETQRLASDETYRDLLKMGCI